MLLIQKLSTGSVQIQHLVTKRVLKELDENATLFYAKEQGGGIFIVDQFGSYYQIEGGQVSSLQILPLAAQAWSGTTAELLAELRANFFKAADTEAHHCDFFIAAPTPPILNFPSDLYLDSQRENTGCFDLNGQGLPVCKVPGKYLISIGLSLFGASGGNASQFETTVFINGVELEGALETLFVNKDEYGASATASMIIDFAAGDVISASLNRVSGGTDPSVLSAFFVAYATKRHTPPPTKAVQLFADSGPINSQFKIWTGTAQSDANGNFVVDFSSAAFSSVPKVFVTAMQTEPNAQDIPWATLSGNISNSQASGYTLRGTSITLIGLGPTIRRAPNINVNIIAIGL